MSVEILHKMSVGNKRMNAISYVASGAEDNITTGLDTVSFFTIATKSVATSAFSMQQNVDSSGTASNGKIGVSGVAAGDEFHITAFGN